MKRRIALVLILVVAAWALGRHFNPVRKEAGGGREEIHENFQLADGARVEVRGINGPVEIATSNGNAAEVHVVRTADSQSDLDGSRVVVEQTSDSLVVRGENNGRGWWSRFFGGGQVRQQVTLSVPRHSRVAAKGINGQVRVGEVDAPVEVGGVNGRVEVAQAAGSTQVVGVNGGVSVTVGQLGGDGLSVKGVNGNVEIRLKENLDADVDIKGLNGSLSFSVPNVTAREELGRSNMRARLGAGGVPFTLKGINGNVRFESAATAR